jgi:hypothetical protein
MQIMKKINSKSVVALSCILFLTLFACNKSFLDKTPQGLLSPSTLSNQVGVEGLLIGAYHMVSGEGRSTRYSLGCSGIKLGLWKRYRR